MEEIIQAQEQIAGPTLEPYAKTIRNFTETLNGDTLTTLFALARGWVVDGYLRISGDGDLVDALGEESWERILDYVDGRLDERFDSWLASGVTYIEALIRALTIREIAWDEILALAQRLKPGNDSFRASFNRAKSYNVHRGAWGEGWYSDKVDYYQTKFLAELETISPNEAPISVLLERARKQKQVIQINIPVRLPVYAAFDDPVVEARVKESLQKYVLEDALHLGLMFRPALTDLRAKAWSKKRTLLHRTYPKLSMAGDDGERHYNKQALPGRVFDDAATYDNAEQAPSEEWLVPLTRSPTAMGYLTQSEVNAAKGAALREVRAIDPVLFDAVMDTMTKTERANFSAAGKRLGFTRQTTAKKWRELIREAQRRGIGPDDWEWSHLTLGQIAATPVRPPGAGPDSDE